MERKSLKPFIALIAILSVFILVCALTTRGRLDSSLPVRGVLPSRIGNYEGTSFLHCQNESCMESFPVEKLTNTPSCAVCGAELGAITLAEKQLLPEDTTILHKTYEDKLGRIFHVSVVIGGHERRSIHKAQRCLVAQGHTITKQYMIKAPITKKETLDVRIMELNKSRMFYAYWFTDGKRETASHIARLFWVAWDGVVHNKRRKWAYLSVFSNEKINSALIMELKSFISRLNSDMQINRTTS